MLVKVRRKTRTSIYQLVEKPRKREISKKEQRMIGENFVKISSNEPLNSGKGNKGGSRANILIGFPIQCVVLRCKFHFLMVEARLF